MTAVAPRLLAFYLPQFHPIPENDRWWGPGFTEWTNVKRARPLFDGHVQPEEPGELGYYDLRSADAREAQAALARAHGISGFCYYHYWFNGQRPLGHVIDEVLSQGQPDFPFCICWANESWTRTWDGLDQDVLMRQTYGAEDDRAHIRWLARAFADPRYIRVGGRPLLLVYRAHHLPSALRTATIWREEAQRLGLGDLYLCSVESLPSDRLDPTRIGFDAAVEFQPDWTQLGAPATTLPDGTQVFDYATTVERMLAKPPAPYVRYPCVTPGWDNSPRRRENAVVLADSSPELYGRWLEAAIGRTSALGADENLVFVNAWNEWGEGAHLEPSARWGRAYLEKTRDVVGRVTVPVWTPPATPAAVRAPRVTVALPTYNGAAHVEAAVESILSQTFEDFELIVIDDCSDDDTIARVSRFRDARLRLERNPVRLGLVRNWNRCLDASRCDYLTIFHQDDVMAPDNLARKVAALDQHPSVAFVHSNVRQIGPDGSVLCEWWYSAPAPGDAGVHAGRAFLERLFWGDNIVCCPSVMLRRDMVPGQEGFDAHLPFTADWEMWMRLCLFHDVAYLPQTLVSYRRHPGAETERFRNVDGLEQHFLAKHRLLTKSGSVLPVGAWRAGLVEHYEGEAVRLAREAVAQGDRQSAMAHLLLAASVHAYVPETNRGDVERAVDLLIRLCDDWDTLKGQLRALESETQALQAAGLGLQTAIQSLEIQNQTLEGENQTLEVRNQELEVRNQTREVQNQTLEAQNRGLEVQSQTLEIQNRGLESEIRALNASIQGFEAEIQALKASGSWRLTAPLRLVLRMVTGRSA